MRGDGLSYLICLTTLNIVEEQKQGAGNEKQEHIQRHHPIVYQYKVGT